MVLALTAAVLQAVSLLLDKVILSKERISRENFIPLLFLTLCVSSGVVSSLVGWVSPTTFLTGEGLLTLAAIVALAASWNSIYFRAIQAERASSVETIMILTPLASILGAGAFFPGQVGWGVIAAAVLSTVILLWGFSTRRELKLDRNLLLLLGSVALMALENLLITKLLAERMISPLTLFSLRTGILALIFHLVYRPHWTRLSPRHLALVVLAGVLGAAMMVVRFYGFRDSGLVETSLALILAPVFVYVGSAIVLRERPRRRQIEAGLLMTVVIIVGLFVTHNA